MWSSGGLCDFCDKAKWPPTLTDLGLWEEDPSEHEEFSVVGWDGVSWAENPEGSEGQRVLGSVSS